jgi:acyl-CoA synthetase (AMP-forming)/AMP-acid ligase II
MVCRGRVSVDLSTAHGFGDVIRQQAVDAPLRTFLVFDDTTFTFAETYREACRYANLFLARRDPTRPFHVGLLLENRPEFVLAELGAALAGAVIVGLNPTRRGAHLTRDVTYSDCQIVLTEGKFAGLLEAGTGAHILVATRFDEANTPALPAGVARLEDALAACPDTDPNAPVADDDLCVIVFTSGTTAAPRGVLRSHQRLLFMSFGAAMMVTSCTPDDRVYCAMPLFHANAQILALGVALTGGAPLVLARRFSKSRFLDDVRRHGCTLFNYVGSPLAYIMDTPERPDDADNPLRLAYGNEGPRQYLEAFARRFGCRVIDSYGASEVGVTFTRQDGDPPGALGRPTPGVTILDEQGHECPPARLDAGGRVTNPEEAIGEIVNTSGPGYFEGYYKNESATRARTRDGHFHTGDLGYRDAEGFVYFAGRDVEWIRVEGENFLARPVEDILQRHPDVFLAAVYAVPDAEAGDRVMAALALREGAGFDAEAFGAFLDRQPDLSPKWAPTYLRLVTDLRRSETNKVVKRELQREGFGGVAGPDPLYWRPRGAHAYRRFTPEDLRILRERFAAAGNLGRIDA